MRGSFENLFFAVNVCFSQIEERNLVLTEKVFDDPCFARENPGRIG